MRAISFLFLADSFLALAGPPFRPPNRPRVTAAGFLVGSSLAGSADGAVANLTISNAVSFMSNFRFLDRLGMH